jgi:protein-S-isoprenylcysteine O-methyltransferase Ste14
MTELMIRALALYVPLVALSLAAMIRRPAPRERGAAILACIWNVPTLLIVHQLAKAQGWWTIQVSGVNGGAQLLGIPLELLVGWTLLWGAFPIIAFRRVPLPIIIAAALAFDVWTMPRCAPVVTLGPNWLIGEAVALALCLLPAQLFARWTRDDRHLAARATLQIVCFTMLTLWLVPSMVLDRLDPGRTIWTNLQRYDTRTLQLLLQLIAIAAIPGLTAAQEFVTRGGGTPVPLDPPKHLVTTGIYAYIANPMQFACVLTLLMWGVILQSWWIAAASTMAIVYGFGFASWVEAQELRDRFGEDWKRYRREVRNWIPRWRPYVPSDTEARLYVAFTCGKCSEVGAWVQRHHPRGLRITPAEHHPTRDLWRITYASADGTYEAEGVAALARAVEHINLGWAMAAFALRLPLIRPCIQLLVDLSGGGPQQIKRTCAPATSRPS